MPTLFPPAYPERPDAPLLGFGPSFSEEISRSVILTISRDENDEPHDHEIRIAAGLTMLEAFHPRDHLECMIAAQGVGFHCAIMETLRRAMEPDQPELLAIKLRANASQLSRTWSNLLKDMERRQSRPLPLRPGEAPPPEAGGAPGDAPPDAPAPGGGAAPKPRSKRARANGSPAVMAGVRQPVAVVPPAPVAANLDDVANPNGVADLDAVPDLNDGTDLDGVANPNGVSGLADVPDPDDVPDLADAQRLNGVPGLADAPGPDDVPDLADAQRLNGVPGLADAPDPDDAPDPPEDMITRPDGTPGSLSGYITKPPEVPFVPREPAIMYALATRPKPWRQVNVPVSETVAAPTVPLADAEVQTASLTRGAVPLAGAEIQQPPLTRGPLDMRERIFTGDALSRFASARLDPDAPIPELVFEHEDSIVELELVSTGGDPEAEAERLAMMAAHPEGKPIVIIRHGTQAPREIPPDPEGDENPPDT